MIFLIVAAGAFAGGFLRWALARLIPGKRATLAANTLACLGAGVVLGVRLPALESALLLTGFCGALSTWSTLARELGQLLSERHWSGLIAYGGATLVLGVMAVALGVALGVALCSGS